VTYQKNFNKLGNFKCHSADTGTVINSVTVSIPTIVRIVMLGVGIFLLVIGAVAAFVLDIDIPGIADDQMLGYILMGAGVLALILAFVQNHQRTSTHRTTRRTPDGNGGFVEEDHIS